MILQQYYTSTNNPLRGSAGFGVRAQSPGIDMTVEQVLASAGAYFHPSDLPDEAVEEMPVLLSFYPIGGGLWGISHSRYVGQDYSHTRYGNYFAHSILCTEADLATIAWMPISLFGNPLWATLETPETPHELPTLPRLPAPPPNLTAGASLFVSQQADGTAFLRQLIQAFIDVHTIAQGRRLVICDEYPNAVNWVTALSLCLPIPLRKSLSFTTYQQYQQLVSGGAYLLSCVERGSLFTPSQYQFDFFVFNRIAGQVSAGIEPKEAATLLAGALKSGNQNLMAEIGSLYELFGCASPADMDTLVLMHRMNSEPITLIDDDLVRRVCEFLAKGQENTLAVRLESIHDYTKSAMLSDDLNKLRMLLPVFYHLSSGGGGEAFDTECLKFLQMQMETPRGINACELYVVDLASIPSLTTMVRKSMTSSNWIQFLTQSDPDEASMLNWMPFLSHVFDDTASRAEIPLWEALADWSERWRSLVFVRTASRLLGNDNLAVPLTFARQVVHLTPDFGSEEGFALLTNAIIDLVRHGVKLADPELHADMAVLVDKMCFPVDMRPYFQRIIQTLSFSPQAVASLAYQIIRKNPRLEKLYLTDIAGAQSDLVANILLVLSDGTATSPVALRIVALSDDSRHLIDVFTAVLSLSKGRPSEEISVLITRLGRKVAASGVDLEGVNSLLRVAHLLKPYPKAYGHLLLAQSRLNHRLTVFTSSADFEAVDAASEEFFSSDTAGGMMHSEVTYLSFQISEIRFGILKSVPWDRLRMNLSSVRSLKADNYPLYLSFVEEAYEAVASKRGRDFYDRMADIYVLTMQKDLQKPLSAILEQVVTEKVNNSNEGGYLITAVLSRLENDPAGLSMIDAKAFVPVLKTLSRSQIDALDQKLRGARKKGPLEAWWSECYFLATATLAQRIRNFFPGSR